MRTLPLVLVMSLAVSAVAVAEPPAVADADVRRGIALVDDGEYDSAIIALDGAVRRLASTPGHAMNDLAEAYFYLGVAYLGKGQETSAKARFRDAVQQARDMSPSPEKFPPRVIELFEKAREEYRAATPVVASSTPPDSASAAEPKKKGGKGLLIAGGAVLAGGGVALAAGGGGGSSGSPTTTTPGQSRTESSAISDQEQVPFTLVASRAGTLEVTITWQDRNVNLSVGCQEQDAPYTQCTGTFNRTTDTTGRFTTPVRQTGYLVLVSNYSGRAGAEPFTITLRYP